MKAASGPFRRLLPGLAAAVFALLFLRTTGCRRYIPEVFGPESTYQGAPTAFRFTIASARGNIDFVVDWVDGMVDTLWDRSPGDTVSTLHTWSDVGGYGVKVMAMLTEDNHTYSEWSSPHDIEILPNGAPTADFDAPVQVLIDVETRFSVWGQDPDGEDIAFQMVFGDDSSDWTRYVASGETTTVSHTFSAAEETLEVRVRAKDDLGTIGPWSDPGIITTTDAGGMLWWWVTPDEDSAAPVTALLVVRRGDTEYVYVFANCAEPTVFGVDVSTGKTGVRRAMSWCYSPTGHPAYNSSTGHILLPMEPGELCALDLDLNVVWRWPGYGPEEEPLTEWGNMCIADNNIYIPNVDTIIRGSDTIPDVTKFYKIPDGPDRPVNPRFAVLGVQEVRGAPVADASGNVFFVTDSGYLYKLDSDLVEQWRIRPGNSTWLYGPVIGQAGAVICGDGDGKVCAVNPEDGLPLWTTMLPDVGEMYIVVGRSDVFVAAGNGHVYSLSPGSGLVQWDKAVSAGGSFSVYPILTRNGYMHAVDDNTKLFCLEQATGSKVWDISCADYYPGGGLRRAGIDDPPPSPTVTSSGSVIIVGRYALYCVSGYSDGTLDTGAPWPKWQHDLHNTGRAGW